jgi:hypothetical protein
VKSISRKKRILSFVVKRGKSEFLLRNSRGEREIERRSMKGFDARGSIRRVLKREENKGRYNTVMKQQDRFGYS